MGDQTIQCVQCGRTFVWSYGEQRYYRERRLDPPKRCKGCRAGRRQERSAPGAARPPTPTARPAGRPSPPPAARPVARPSTPPRENPALRFGPIAFAAALALAAAIVVFGLIGDPIAAWLIAITLVTFLAYGYDKLIAGSSWTRVPESVLLALALAGGSLGALAGMQLFRHKTAKLAFRSKFWLVVVVQVAVLAVYYWIILPALA